MTDTTITAATGDATTGAPRFAFSAHLDPLRHVQGTRMRYDCPDLAAVDRHLAGLHRRLAAARRSPAADACRADIDRLLDRRTWLMLPIVADGAARGGADAPCGRIGR